MTSLPLRDIMNLLFAHIVPSRKHDLKDPSGGRGGKLPLFCQKYIIVSYLAGKYWLYYVLLLPDKFSEISILISVRVCSFVHLFIRSFVRSFIRSFVHSFVRSFIRMSPFYHSESWIILNYPCGSCYCTMVCNSPPRQVHTCALVKRCRELMSCMATPRLGVTLSFPFPKPDRQTDRKWLLSPSSAPLISCSSAQRALSPTFVLSYCSTIGGTWWLSRSLYRCRHDEMQYLGRFANTC